MNVEQIIKLLSAEYGEKRWRPRQSPVEVLVQTILSQNTSDRNSGRAFERLVDSFGSWEDMANASIGEISHSIKAGGLGEVKARYIKQALEEIRRRLDEFELDFLRKLPVDEARDWLRQLPGVGMKTASCVLIFSLGMPALPVDTHVLRVAKRLGLMVISSDVTRKQLAGIPITEHRFEEFDSGIYSFEFSSKTYDKMFSEAKHILSDGGSVILDASFIKTEERLKAKRLAEETGADFFIIECILDEESIKQRLAQRLEQETISDGRWEIYQPQKRAFAPVVEASPQKHVIIDTSKPVEENIRQILELSSKGGEVRIQQ